MNPARAQRPSWRCYVKITDPTQIRTALAFPYPSKNTVRVERMAKQNNAVLAINGDYFIYHLKESSIATRTVCVNCPANTATR